MLLIGFALFVGTLIAFYNFKVTAVLAVGAFAHLIYACICFFVKKGSRPFVVWWGIIALAMAGWWIFLLSKAS